MKLYILEGQDERTIIMVQFLSSNAVPPLVLPIMVWSMALWARAAISVRENCQHGKQTNCHTSWNHLTCAVHTCALCPTVMWVGGTHGCMRSKRTLWWCADYHLWYFLNFLNPRQRCVIRVHGWPICTVGQSFVAMPIICQQSSDFIPLNIKERPKSHTWRGELHEANSPRTAGALVRGRASLFTYWGHRRPFFKPHTNDNLRLRRFTQVYACAGVNLWDYILIKIPPLLLS